MYMHVHTSDRVVLHMYILYVYISDCSVLLVQSVISIVLKSHPELNDRRMGLPSLAFRFRCVRKPSDVISRLAVKATRKISQPIEVSLFVGRQLTYQAWVHPEGKVDSAKKRKKRCLKKCTAGYSRLELEVVTRFLPNLKHFFSETSRLTFFGCVIVAVGRLSVLKQNGIDSVKSSLLFDEGQGIP